MKRLHKDSAPLEYSSLNTSGIRSYHHLHGYYLPPSLQRANSHSHSDLSAVAPLAAASIGVLLYSILSIELLADLHCLSNDDIT
jgi:hypothetical protein